MYAGISDSVLVGPPPETMVGNIRVWDLRNCKQVVIPEGTERIENQWFWGSEIESVEIPASVKKIDKEVFYNCKHLGHVVFAEGSQLEKIGPRCFYKAGI